MTFPWIKRTDLIAIRHDGGGWIVKDPLTLQYALLEDHEYSILNLLDGRYGFAELLRRARSVAPWLELTAEDLAEFIRNLAGNQLIRQRTGGDSVRLNPDAGRSSVSRVLRFLFQLLRIQFRLLNPSRLIDAAAPVAAVFYRKTALSLFGILAIVAVAIVTTSLGEVVQSLPTLQEFLGPQNVVMMLGVFITVKILHEAGHAFTAKHFGAECNECGIMLMVFTPVLYTNVSDSWMLPRQQRMLVTAAGILVELGIAAVCTILWWHASPGLAKSILLNTMVLCSLNTLLFNGNPLLRFDGYFLLADWMNIPNLANRSSGVLRDFVISLVTGRSAEPHTATTRHDRILLIYGIMSAAYRLFLTLAILKLVDELTRQWHVRFLGSILFVIIVTGFLLIPGLGFLQSVRQQHQQHPFERRNRIRAAFILGIFLVSLLIPIPGSILAPAFIQPTAHAVYAPLSGRMVRTSEYGSHLNNGDLVAELANPELELTRQRLKSHVKSLNTELRTLRSHPETADSDLILSLEKTLKAAEQRQQDFEEEYSELHILTKKSGVFLSPEAVAKPVRDDLPGHWHGVVAEGANTGAWIERGTLLGYVGEPSDLSLLIAIEESDVSFVRPGQRLTFSKAVDTGVHRQGIIHEVGLLESDELPMQFAVAGLVNGRITESGLIPSAVTFLAVGRLADDPDAIPPALYSAGQVRIQVASASIFDRIVRYLKQTF